MGTEFRELNGNERSVIIAAHDKGRIRHEDPRILHLDDARVSYEREQGGFCVACLILGDQVWTGASRRSYKDPRKPIKGEMLAFSRAVLYARPATLPGRNEARTEPPIAAEVAS